MTTHRIQRGLELPLAGAPDQRVEAGAPVHQVALLGTDTVGLRPVLAVQPGDRVRRGQLLYEDRRNPGVRFTSPAAGVVRALNRGERRALVSLVIDVDAGDGPQAQAAFSPPSRHPSHADGAALRRLLVESGLWTSFRARPFGHVPPPQGTPLAVFVTAIDTQPHAPDPQVALLGREEDFRLGLVAIERIADVPVYLCVAPGWQLTLDPASRAQLHVFDGPHPAGTPGLHMHMLHPVGIDRVVWHIGYQDVAAIGHLLACGELDLQRVISIAGPAVRRPRLLRTRLGASLAELTAGELQPGDVRVLSGSVLDGRAVNATADAFLGRHHRQVSALFEGRERQLFGWIRPQRHKYSLWKVVAGHFARARRSAALPLTTSTNGGERAMVPIGSYERVLPMDIMATHLLRALASGDAQQAVALGALELDEEDLALATFVCPGKTEWGPLLRRTLERVEKEGA